MGISIFLIFAPKQRLWILVRTASARWLKRVPTIYVLSKNKKNVKNFLMKIFNFYNIRKICISHGHVLVMSLNQILGVHCLFELMLSVQVNSYGHVASILWDFYPKLGCHDIQKVLQILPPK